MINTTFITVGSAWTMITDGTQTQTKSVQILSGVILLIDSDDMPASDVNVGHVVNGWMTITPPTKAWARVTAGTEARLAIS